MGATPAPPLPDWLLGILRCPACRHELVVDAAELRCTGTECGLRYRIEEGIPVLLVDEALPPER